MPNLADDVRATGHETLADRPFSATDSLALTQIIYMPMETLADGGHTTTVSALWTHLATHNPDGFADPFQQKRYHFTEVCAASARYQALRIADYGNHVDPRQETQFCAATFWLPDGQRYVAFRGTDLTLVGWKEDLNMSYMAVPAQREAVAYVRKAAEAFDGPLLLGGHSKGGHLALYAAAHQSPEVQARIRCVYSFDGPGVDEATLLGEGYGRISTAVESYLPQSSVVGMLLCYHPVFHVVRSTGIGLWQHDAFTWQVRDGAFLLLEELDLAARVADEALRQWIDRLTQEDRQFLTETVFRMIAALDTETIDPIVQDFALSTLKMFGAYRRLEPETRDKARRLLGELFSSGASEAVRQLLPATFRRFVEAPPPATPLAEQIRHKQEELAEVLDTESMPPAEQ